MDGGRIACKDVGVLARASRIDQFTRQPRESILGVIGTTARLATNRPERTKNSSVLAVWCRVVHGRELSLSCSAAFPMPRLSAVGRGVSFWYAVDRRDGMNTGGLAEDGQMARRQGCRRSPCNAQNLELSRVREDCYCDVGRHWCMHAEVPIFRSAPDWASSRPKPTLCLETRAIKHELLWTPWSS
jgi:hypothetical protein